MNAHFINVGQGDATLLEFPCGAILVDAGAQDQEHVEILIGYLADFFDERRPDLANTLNSVIITHNHLDHTRALRSVFEYFVVERYIDNGQLNGAGSENPRWVRSIEGSQQVVVREISSSDLSADSDQQGLTDADIDPIDCATCDPHVRILAGRFDENPGWSLNDFENQNNHSIVVRIDFGESSFLFTGDLEEPAIRTLLERYSGTHTLDVDALQVGHHGSDSGTTADFLQAITPEIAVISVGHWEFGRIVGTPFSTFAYGHPRKRVIEMLSLMVSRFRDSPVSAMSARSARSFEPYTVEKRIYATAWDGNVVVQASATGEYSISSYSIDGPPRIGAQSPPHASAIGLAAPNPARHALAFALFVPQTAAVGSKHTVRLAIGDETQVRRWEQTTAMLKNHQDDRRISQSLSVRASHILVTLKGLGLTVEPHSLQTAAGAIDQLHEYIWYVTVDPLEGSHTVDLKVTPYQSALLQEPGQSSTYPYEIPTLAPTWRQRAWRVLQSRWQWVTTALLIPLAGIVIQVLRHRRQRRERFSLTLDITPVGQSLQVTVSVVNRSAFPIHVRTVYFTAPREVDDTKRVRTIDRYTMTCSGASENGIERNAALRFVYLWSPGGAEKVALIPPRDLQIVATTQTGVARTIKGGLIKAAAIDTSRRSKGV